MSTGNGYQAGKDAAAAGRAIPQSQNHTIQQNILDGFKAGSKK
jgi:hypothetical protein